MDITNDNQLVLENLKKNVYILYYLNLSYTFSYLYFNLFLNQTYTNYDLIFINIINILGIGLDKTTKYILKKNINVVYIILVLSKLISELLIYNNFILEKIFLIGMFLHAGRIVTALEMVEYEVKNKDNSLVLKLNNVMEKVKNFDPEQKKMFKLKLIEQMNHFVKLKNEILEKNKELESRIIEKKNKLEKNIINKED